MKGQRWQGRAEGTICPHCHLVAARLGEMEFALRSLEETAAIDLSEAVHGEVPAVRTSPPLAAVASCGAWLRRRNSDRQRFVGGAAFVAGLAEPGFCVCWQGRRVRIRINAEGCAVPATLEQGAATMLAVHGTTHALRPDENGRVGSRPGCGRQSAAKIPQSGESKRLATCVCRIASDSNSYTQICFGRNTAILSTTIAVSE